MLTSLLMLQALHGGPKTRTLLGIRSRQKVRAVTEAYVSVSALGARLPHTQHVHRCTPPRTGRPRLGERREAFQTCKTSGRHRRVVAEQRRREKEQHYDGEHSTA